jgi:hypothetical protein
MMFFIDLPDGSVMVPFDVERVFETAKKLQGRVRAIAPGRAGMVMSTTDPMAGCVQLADYRPKGQAAPPEVVKQLLSGIGTGGEV